MVRSESLSPRKLAVKTPEELRDFFNKGGIEDLAAPLDDLLTGDDSDVENQVVRIRDEEYVSEEFSAYWMNPIRQTESRLLIVRSNLSRIAGLYLHVPVQPDSYQLATGGLIAASYSPRLPHGRHRVGHYLKQGNAPAIGDPSVAVRVHRIARRQLLKAGQLVKLDEPYWPQDHGEEI